MASPLVGALICGAGVYLAAYAVASQYDEVFGFTGPGGWALVFILGLIGVLVGIDLLITPLLPERGVSGYVLSLAIQVVTGLIVAVGLHHNNGRYAKWLLTPIRR